MPFAVSISPQSPETKASSGKRCKIFVSYSHKNSEDAKQFVQFLSLKLKGVEELEIDPEHIFFDRNKLLAGDDWDDSIQCAIEEAQCFVLLVSVDSLSSKYCCSRELKVAAGRLLPIIPILLKPCPWEDLTVPGDASKRKLGALGALPKDEQFQLRSIEAWPKGRDDAWTQAVTQLADRLRRDRNRPGSEQLAVEALSATRPQPSVPPLLPYFCNQVHVETHFNQHVTTWKSHSLLVLARGLYDDNVPRFWERLQHKNLRDYLAVHNGALLEPKALVWPVTAELKLGEKEMGAAMMSALSQSLVGSAFLLNDELSLSRHLGSLPGVVPLFTSFPKASKKLLATGVRALLTLLEQSSTDTPLYRLVITIFIEDETLVGEKDLRRTLKLNGFQRTDLIDLTPLKEIDEGDIRSWHRAYDVEKLCRVSEEKLVRKIFSENLPRPLRLRKFAEKVEAFL